MRAIDSASLAPVGESVPILEYHAHAVASPDGLRIAAAIGSPQVGSVRIVNLSTLELVTTKAGIAAEAIVWLDNDRVVAGLERGVPADAVRAQDGSIAYGGTLDGIVGIARDRRRWTRSSAELGGRAAFVHAVAGRAFVVARDNVDHYPHRRT